MIPATDTNGGTSESNIDDNYDMIGKMREFLHSDVHMLEYKNMNKSEENTDRIKILYSKFFQPYKVIPEKKIDYENNGNYFGAFMI